MKLKFPNLNKLLVAATLSVFAWTNSGNAQDYKAITVYQNTADYQSHKGTEAQGYFKLLNSSPPTVNRYKVVTPKQRGKANKKVIYETDTAFFIHSRTYSGSGRHYVVPEVMLQNFAYVIDVSPDMEANKAGTGALIGGAIGGAIAASNARKLEPTQYIVMFNPLESYPLIPSIMESLCRGNQDLYVAWEKEQTREATIDTLMKLDERLTATGQK